MKILIATVKPFAAEAVEGIKEVFKEAGHEVALLEKYADQSELLKAVEDADALIVRSDKITKEVLDAAKKLKIIVRAGAGYDSIDTQYAKEKNIIVENTPGQNANAVAELVLSLLVYAVRNFYNGKPGTELKGKRLGIYGFGNVGRNVARVANGFGLKITAFDVFNFNNTGVEFVEEASSVEEMFKNSNFISLHLPFTPETEKCINAKLVGLMPENGVLVNTARKEIINEEELLKLMEERPDLKFITDIKPDADEEFAKLEGRYFSTPKKMGAQTAEANINAGLAAAKQICEYFADNTVKFQVNK